MTRQDDEMKEMVNRASVQGRLQMVVEMLEQAINELRAEIQGEGDDSDGRTGPGS